MSQDDQNPFDGFKDEDGDDAVWLGVTTLLALLMLAFVCWLA